MQNEPENNISPQSPEQSQISNSSNEVGSNPPPQPSQEIALPSENIVSTGSTNDTQLSDNVGFIPSPSPIVVGSGEPSIAPAPHFSPSVTPQIGVPIVGGASSPMQSVSTPASKKFRIKSKLTLVVVAALVVLGGGAAAAYYGYYMNPSTIWSDSLSNTSNGYNKLVSYLNGQSTKHYSGINENGTFNISINGKSYDGSLNAQSYNTNTTISMKLDLGVTKVDLEERSILAAGSTAPDLYVQLSGIKGIGSYLGSDFGPQIDSLDGQWISIDHNLLSDLDQQILKNQVTQPATSAPLTWPELYSFLHAEGKVNQKYLFSTDKSTAVMSIVHDYGMQTLNGHQTYHYKIGFVKANVKSYISALCSTLEQSDFGTNLKQSLGQSLNMASSCTDLENSTNAINSADDIDIWTDVNQRLIYQVQADDASNPAQSFVDFGLDYKGGDSYPFFISAHAKNGSDIVTYYLNATLNTKLNGISVKVNAVDTGSQAGNLSANLSIQPRTTKLNLVPPANAKPITTILSNLGLSPFLLGLPNLNASTVEFISPLLSPTATPLLL